MEYCTYTKQPFKITLYSDGQALFGLYLGDHLPSFNEKLCENANATIFQNTIAELDRYFQGEAVTFDIPLDLKGTPFQLKVWEILRKVPYGTTITYGQLRDLIDPSGRLSAQAVGQAVKRNPVSIIIPCHRVISSHGLGGYNGGMDYKIALLQIEKSL